MFENKRLCFEHPGAELSLGALVAAGGPGALARHGQLGRVASAAAHRPRMLNTRGVSFFNDLNTNHARILARKTCMLLYCIHRPLEHPFTKKVL